MKSEVTFTKKDLVVVLACIVFLLVNIAAVGQGGRRRAKEAVCLSNLLKWGEIFQAYTADNDGYFPPRGDYAIPASSYEGYWMVALEPYLEEGNYQLWLCPMATKTWEEIGFTSFTAYDGYRDGDPDYPKDNITSYGMNTWCYNSGDEGYWKSANVGGANNIPLFADCCYPGGGPRHTDSPPVWPGNPSTGGNKIQRYCLDRHDGAINMLFMDFSVRKIPLKCLWKLKWSRIYDVNADTTEPDWATEAPWMEGFKECDY